tara:strand:+ start:148 stop:333 length:186 start_codon:yes stop_codon:yes gene_type:complete
MNSPTIVLKVIFQGFSIFKSNKLLIFLPIPDNERYEKEPRINDIKGIKVGFQLSIYVNPFI